MRPYEPVVFIIAITVNIILWDEDTGNNSSFSVMWTSQQWAKKGGTSPVPAVNIHPSNSSDSNTHMCVQTHIWHIISKQMVNCSFCRVKYRCLLSVLFVFVCLFFYLLWQLTDKSNQHFLPYLIMQIKWKIKNIPNNNAFDPDWSLKFNINK